MIGFELLVNGQTACTAGVGDFGVLSAVVTWVRRRAENSRDGKSIEEELTFEVGGLANHEHLRWFERALAVGDEVSIKIIEVADVDPAPKRVREDPMQVEKSERRYYEHLRKKYGDGAA